MFDIGFLEIMVVGVLGLIILGPERLPKAARTVALFWGKIRRTMTDFQDDIERQIRTEELKEKLNDPYTSFMDEDEREAKAAKEHEYEAQADLYGSVIAEQDQRQADAQVADGNHTSDSSSQQDTKHS